MAKTIKFYDDYKKMLTKRTAIKVIKDFTAACAEKNIIFSKIILFGSVVSGRMNEYSDIDVALVSKQFTGNPIADWHLLSLVKITNPKFTDIEPHPYSVKDFYTSDPFIEEIKKTGVEINI